MVVPARTKRLKISIIYVVVAFTLYGCEKDDGMDHSGFTLDSSSPSTTTETPRRALQPLSESEEMQALRSQLAAANLQITRLEAMLQHCSKPHHGVTCTEDCASLSKTGRWRFGKYGHACEDPFSGKTYCHCSEQSGFDDACAEVLNMGSRRLRAGNAKTNLGRALLSTESLSQESSNRSINTHTIQMKERLQEGHDKDLQYHSADMQPINLASQQYDLQPVADARLLGSPTETIATYCNTSALLRMHGHHTHELSGSDVLKHLESSVLADVAEEMDDNNVDKVARDMFSFYVCVRWVPDDLFWQLARQELAANLVESVIDHNENLDQAISELYQNYKYVPLLCSRNFNVFDETDEDDHTYFRYFKKQVTSFVEWLSDHDGDEVAQRLHQVDEVFCGATNMNDPGCSRSMSFDSFMNRMTGFLGSWGWNADTVADKWAAMKDLFNTFDLHAGGQSPTWSSTIADWKSRFPFHSFIQKPAGMPHQQSPLSSQRFLVCFGKRVASELHRRPAGQHLMTDQNNVGCHGFWETLEIKNMLNHMLELWKPPTCQMAEMTYTMKRQILKMYTEMNERLFDALPSLLMDEALDMDGMLKAHTAGPAPYNPQVTVYQGLEYIDGMRVRAVSKVKDPEDCVNSGWFSSFDFQQDCRLEIDIGNYGTIVTKDGDLHVVWDKDSEAQAVRVSHTDVRVVPRDWRAHDPVKSWASNIVAGVSSVSDKIKEIYDSLFRTRYTNLADLMSGSTSKWVVCPVQNDINFTDLDAQIGVEDAAFRDHQREAYSRWTGYMSHIPGEVCVAPDFFSQAEFPESEMCEISELHADHLEKYTNDDGSLEEFMCPLKTSMPAPEQLTVLKDKGTCLLHMTSEQQRHYQWPYNGDYPNRRQYDRKPNLPNAEYELVKLLHVPTDGKVSYARGCSVDELVHSPRFCPPMELHNTWPTLEEMAKALGDAVVGSLGMGASAITDAVSMYGTVVSENKNTSDLLQEVGQAVGEDMWDHLTGAGRLIQSAAERASDSVSFGIPGAAQRDKRIENGFFQEVNAGLLLHRLSFQRSVGADNRTSNAKERYQRVVVTMPCAKFNPALEFAVKKTWTSNVLRMVQSAVNSGLQSVLDTPIVQFSVRGEGRLFHRVQSTGEESFWFRYGAAMSVHKNGEISQLADCKWENWFTCGPAEHCQAVGMIGFRKCVPKVRVTASGWWSVLDSGLVSVVAPSVSRGYHPATDLKGFVGTMYCGEKRRFSHGDNYMSSESLLSCMRHGVESNARLRASAPWKLYFPEEVIVVVVFQAITERYCIKQSQDVSSSMQSRLCAEGAVHTDGLDDHLLAADTEDQNGNYQGLLTGARFPQGTPVEIVLRPEDVLEAAGLLSRS